MSPLFDFALACCLRGGTCHPNPVFMSFRLKTNRLQTSRYQAVVTSGKLIKIVLFDVFAQLLSRCQTKLLLTSAWRHLGRWHSLVTQMNWCLRCRCCHLLCLRTGGLFALRVSIQKSFSVWKRHQDRRIQLINTMTLVNV